ncbi:MAG: insulinase family protein [Acidobacteria bacterium]|nr:insulinase family protein [Acidobacteriota bacterium]
MARVVRGIEHELLAAAVIYREIESHFHVRSLYPTTLVGQAQRPGIGCGGVEYATLPFIKQTLANALDVIVHEDHHIPIVAVNIWYHVGSKDEQPGRTGFAHLFEHLMFEGSEHHNSGFFPPLQQAGALLNGSTNTDRTNYWEVVPTSALDRALWMESDRMGYLLPALTQDRFETQRDVVLNERRQNYENRPYGFAMMAMTAALFPEDHPYHWPTIGSPDDIRAMRLEEVRDFFRTYYHPGNASLTLAGDIDPARALELVERYFGDLPAGPKPQSVRAVAALDRERRLLLEDRVELPRVYMAWHSPRIFADGDAEMDLLADLLANGKTSRLYRTLVFERRVALDVSAAQSSRELAGFFLLVATAAPGQSLTEICAVIDVELQRLAEAGPSEAEMERARAQTEAQFMYRLQTIGGFGGKSDQLNAYNVFRGDPGFFATDLARYRDATRDGVGAAARRTLTRDRRVVLSVVPRGQAPLALPGSDQVSVF